ncbi:MAG: FtsQ-type POTRA domain-containing protein [Syntrophomonadaceae bacterium]|nr:FtsQ-type POTRA domain-containing protein [Syntrophomonadaceae bacterium]
MSNKRGKTFKNMLMILAMILAFYLGLHSPLFVIQSIEVNGNRVVAQEEVEMLADISDNSNIFMANLPMMSKSIAIHPLIKTVEIGRKLPDTLKITITERDIWAVIPCEQSYLYVDEEGVLLDQRLTADLEVWPLLTLSDFPDYLVRGQAVNHEAAVLAHSVSVTLTDAMRQRISEYHYDTGSKELYIYTLDGAEIRFGSDERLEDKLVELAEVLELEQEMMVAGKEAIQYADIRYAGQSVLKLSE